ncbi:MAG TPA: NHL repeat-containing protein [Chloroflexota bacterium]
MRGPRILRFLLLALLLGLPGGMAAPSVQAAPVSGTWQVLGAAGSLPTLYRPAGLAVDARGNLYVADAGNFRVVEIGPGGRLLAHFGDADLRPGPGSPPRPGGLGMEATGPTSLAVDAHGTVYVADLNGSTIRVFSAHHHLVDDWPISVPDASVYRLAVAMGASGNVIVAIVARVNCTVPDGPAYCAMYYIVQRRSPAGALLSEFHSPVAASGMDAGGSALSWIAATVDARGNIYIATAGTVLCYKSCPDFHFLVKYRFDGTVLGRWDVLGLATQPDWSALAIGGRGNLFLADDFNHLIEKRTTSGTVMARWSLGGLLPRIVTGPSGIAVNRNGNVYVSDPTSGRVLTLSSAGKVLAQWGSGGSQAGRFWSPGSLVLDAKGRLRVDDYVNSRVQMLGSDGRFRVQFAVPHAGPGMALDRPGNLYIGQQFGQTIDISKFSSTGKLLARWGRFHLAELPTGIAVAPNGDIFVAGIFYFGNDTSQLGMDGTDILRLSSSGRQLGLVHVTAGLTGTGIAVDAQENTYIAYGTTPRFEKRTRDGTLLATWGASAPLSHWPSPSGITLDAKGNVYVANTPQNVIQEFGPTGTLLGTWGFHGSYPGQFHHPAGVAVAPNGTIYVADTDNHRIQRLTR